MTDSQPPTKKARRDESTVYQKQLATAKKSFASDYALIHQRAAKCATAAARIVEHQSVICRQPVVIGKSVAQALVEKFESTPGRFAEHVGGFMGALDSLSEENGDFSNWLGQFMPTDFGLPLTTRGKLMAWDLVLLALQHFTLSPAVQAALDAYDASSDSEAEESVGRLTYALDSDPFIVNSQEKDEDVDTNDDDEEEDKASSEEEDE